MSVEPSPRDSAFRGQWRASIPRLVPEGRPMPSVAESSIEITGLREEEMVQQDTKAGCPSTPGSSSAGSPEWTPRDLPEEQFRQDGPTHRGPPQIPAPHFRDGFMAPASVTHHSRPSVPALAFREFRDAARGSREEEFGLAERSPRRTPRNGRPPLGQRERERQIERGGKMPVQFDIYTPRPECRYVEDYPFLGTPQRPEPELYDRESPQKSDIFLRMAGDPKRRLERQDGPSAYPASVSSGTSPYFDISKSKRSKSAAPKLDLHVSSARAELAIACAQFKETAVEVRRRERRLRHLEHLAAEDDDKDNLRAFHASSPIASGSSCSSMPAGVACVAMAAPQLQPAGGNVVRRTCNRAAEEDLSESNKRERRIKKELRLERKMRRRAEDAVASVWWNTLMAVGAVSLCVIGVVALSVAFSSRR